MTDDDKNENETAAEEAEISQNFGNQRATDAPTKYVANFTGDEVDGHRYELGEELKDNVDAGTIAYLVQNGRFTPKSPGDSNEPAGGTEEAIPGNAKDEGGAAEEVTLTEAEQTEADALVADNSKDDLLALADGVAGVTKDNNKAEIAAKLVASRRT